MRLAGGGGVYPAVPVFVDRERDFALLAIPGHFDVFTSVTEALAPVRVRQTVVAVGYPIDPARSDPQSSRGIVSGAGDDGMLQLDIGVNPGNSGGPLIDEQEHVVGVVVARGRLEAGIQSIGYAVPISAMRAEIERALAGSFARARRRFEQNPTEWSRLAKIVDASVRVGALGVLANIVHAVDSAGMQTLIDELQQLSTQVTEPDLKVLIAAVFWNASIALLERVGGREFAPYTLSVRALNRDAIIRLADRALQLCLEAVLADREAGSRSTFARNLAATARARHLLPSAGARTDQRSGAAPATAAAPTSGGAASAPAPPSASHGSLPREVIATVMRAGNSQVRACYERELASRPGLQGTVIVRFVIAPSGVVQMAAVARSDLDSPSVENCISAAVLRFVFPPPSGGGSVVVSYPFRVASVPAR